MSESRAASRQLRVPSRSGRWRLAVLATFLVGSVLSPRFRASSPETQREPTILEWLKSEERFDLFLGLLSEAELGAALFDSDETTLFVPIDSAFENYSSEALALLRSQENRSDLVEMLRFHAAAGKWDLDALGKNVRVESLQGQDLALRWLGGDQYSIDVARIRESDIACKNGIVHVIDEPLLPVGLKIASALRPESKEPGTYEVDLDHSSVIFRLMHMEVGAMWGWFNRFEGKVVVAGEDMSDSSLELTVEVASIDTRNQARDSYLQSKDFFDAKNHPALTFKSSSITRSATDRIRVSGELSCRGISRPVEFEARKLGEGRFGPDWYKIGYEAELTFLRSDFGMTFGIPGVAGDEVRLVVALECSRPFE